MALNDYIMCARCDRKLIYDAPDSDGHTNRLWWIEQFGKEPEILCPPCQQEQAMQRVSDIGQGMEDAKDGSRWRFMKMLPRHKIDRIVYSEPDSWDAVIDTMQQEQKK